MIGRLAVRAWNAAIDLAGGGLGLAIAAAADRRLVHFPFASEALSVVPFSFGWKLRRAAYARILPRVGTDAVLHFGVTIEDRRSTFGDDVWISVGTYVDYALVGDSVLVGPRAVLLAGGRQHRFDRLDVPIKQQGNPAKEPIRIGDGAWIGANATVMAEVGAGAIVGAGSVVTRRVPPLAIVAGNPARILRMRGESPRQPADAVAASGGDAACG